MARVIFWLRRDLRLTDNTAFYQTKRQTRDIIPAYILSPWKKRHAWTGSNRQLFLCGCLEHLSESLVQAGSRLIIRAGEPVETLILLARESKADAIAYNRLYDPFDIALEKRLQAAAAQEGLKLHAHHDISIHSPGALLNQSGQPFRVFSPFARAWHKLAKPACLPRVTNLQAPPDLRSLPVPTLKFWDLTPEAQVVEAGEKAAAGRLRRFLTRQVFSYGAKRNFPSAAGTSRLSQDLRHGTLSPRTIYHACHEAAGECTAAQRTSLNSFVNEIVWREFYLQILWHHPEVLDQDFNPEFTKLRWDRNEGAFQKWAAGQTGFPLVDAGMRELNATGFMHNRLRLITAMFLTKDLHIHWRTGESYFLQKLVDGEIASNNGGWQWSAGTGADAAPYFRIQNPWQQTKAYDPQGEYIKRWVPELVEVDATRFQQPPAEPLAPDYPLPMVEHSTEREETIRRFNQVKNR